jgi:LysM repeat protein
MAISQTYQLQPGDTLSAVADAQHLTLAELLVANSSISNPNKVLVGEAIAIPLVTAEEYDGIYPASGTTLPTRPR